MKKTAIFISFLAMGAFVANAQDKTTTPGTTKTQNETKSSTTTNDSRDLNNSGNTSTSEGTMSLSGSKSLHSGTRLEISDLPKVVSENISSQHKGWTPQEVYKFDNQGATAYEVVVKRDDEELNLIYDASGNLLRTEQRNSLGKSPDSKKTETR